MKKIKFHLQGGLNEEQLHQIHNEVLQVLDKIGVECNHKKTLEVLAGCEGIKVIGNRIYFSPDTVNVYIEKARNNKFGELTESDNITISGPWNCFNIEDMETGKVRPSTSLDVREMYKLVYVAKSGDICPVYPTDIEPPLQLLYLEKTGIELTNTCGSLMEFSDRQMLEFAIQMYKVAGRKYNMLVQFPISPLRLNPSALQTIWDYMDRNDICLFPASAPIPQAGLTAPIFLPGALVQSVAETFAGYIVIDKISNGKLKCFPQYRIDLFDMRYMTTVFASPEHILYQLLLKDVARYFSGKPLVEHYFCCNAKRCDLQSMLERTSWILTLALAGFRKFGLGAGQLSMDEVFSPAQFIIDYEIARYVTHIIRGIEYEDTPGISFKTISEVVPGNNFLTHQTTLERLGQQFESDLFPRTNVGQWRTSGEPDIWKKAVGKAKEMIKSYNYQIDPSIQKELDRIYAEAKVYVNKKGI